MFVLVQRSATSTFRVALPVPTADQPQIKSTYEPYFGLAYLNLWASNVDYGGEDFDGVGIDVQPGIKRWYDYTNPLWFDVGYVHYFFSPKSITPDYGEIFGRLKYVFGDFALGTDVYFAPDISQSGKTATYVEGNAEFYFSDEFSLSGAIGYQFSQSPTFFEYLTWNVGVSYTRNIATFDLRYSDTTLSGDECIFNTGFTNGCDARVVATIYLDTSLSKLIRPIGEFGLRNAGAKS